MRLLLPVLLLSLRVGAVDVVVLPVAGLQPPAVRATVTSAVRAEATDLGLDVLAAPATDRVLADAAAFGNNCAVTVSTCALQMGSLAGGRRVIVGAIDGSVLTLRAYDVVTERELGRIVVPFDAGQPAAAARVATIRLLRPEAEIGTLALTVDVLGAVVEVDGLQVGTTPLPPIPLAPGHHTVDVRPRELELTFQSVPFDITLGEVTSVEVTFRVRAGSGRGTGTGPPPVVSVYFLDVEAPPELALPAALLTVALVDETRNWLGEDGRVGSPEELARLATQTVGIADCVADPGCIRGRLGAAPVEVVATTLAAANDRLVVKAIRFRLDADGTVAHAEAYASPAGQGSALTRQVGPVVSTLFPEGRGRFTMSEALTQRFDPPPLPVLAWAGTLSGLVVGAVVGGGSLVAYTGTTPDDPARPAWGAGVVVGAIVAAAGLAGTVVEIPFVDWRGLQGDNALLLEERAARGYSSR